MSVRPVGIGDASKSTGLSVKAIRHYEAIGLIQPANRTEAGYRLYAAQDLHALRFIRQARSLGFPIETIAALLGLWRDRDRPSQAVKALASSHMAALDTKLRELEAMKRTLAELIDHCHGDARPECPILENLATPGGAVPREDAHRCAIDVGAKGPPGR
jgi:MerR family copper efflux transcriptional regulator